MQSRIPNLWGKNDDAERLYALFLCQLLIDERYERIVQACRQIRSHAARGPGIKAGLSTFWMEIDALFELGHYTMAWRQARLRDRICYGTTIDYATHAWRPEESWHLLYTVAPLLYYTGQFKLGCQVMEAGLEIWFKDVRGERDTLVYHVIARQQKPTIRQEIGLEHFYRKLGKDLSEWQYWKNFVHCFPAKLQRKFGISAEVMENNSIKARQFVRLWRKHQQDESNGTEQSQQPSKDDVLREKHKQEQRKAMQLQLEALFPELKSNARRSRS